jgi:hypothetical protein
MIINNIDMGNIDQNYVRHLFAKTIADLELYI